ncbi:hypothetical protein SVAN01_03194 [Stagonosporopsis vannaccii]|nr:hypothetical protein SVAN01_03194 [Stagonosporopsis vannaccii]
MPRQLPWKTGGGGSRTQTIKPSIRPQKPNKVPDDIDDGFLAHAALSGSSKSKGQSKARATSNSDDVLPGPSASRSKKTEDTLLEPRAASSSPPPLTYDALPNELMRKGVSKFDLRDDEWMMVEDEFLETAKLFTRHLHIAEYDRLKETIEAKKKAAEIARPVVAGVKRSVEGAMREGAKAQESRQKKAIRDVFATLGDESEKEDEDAAHRVSLSKSLSTTKPQTSARISHDTDSDDLDAPRAPKPKRAAPTSNIISNPQAPAPPSSKPAPSFFAKPALPAPPAAARPRRAPRMTPFDMLDGYDPPPTTTSAPPNPSPRDNARSQTTSTQSSLQPSQTAKAVRPRRSIDLLDDWESGSNGSGVSKEVAERVAKRKAERAKEGDANGKKRVTRIDDIPTFLI